MTDLYDYVIVGSGPSGSVLARYLTQAGARCLMLEAGQAYSAATFPRNEMLANTQLMWNGGMDASRDASLLFLRGKVLGGGSIINQCLLDRFDATALDDWAQRSGIDAFSVAAMARHYAAVESQLQLHTFERSEWNRNAALYVEGFERCGMQWAPLRRGQSDCGEGNDCMACLGGCVRDSKQSMPVTFLKQACADGLEIRTNFEVTQVIHGARHVTLYGHHNGQVAQVQGRKCILAAGALGTTQLLLRSGLGEQLPALGREFNCHPQLMTLARFDDLIDAHKGAFQAVKSDDPRFRAQGFKLENVFAGPIAIALLKPGFGREHQRFMQHYRHLACIEVAVRDATAGTIAVDRQGRLRISKTLAAADWARANAGLHAVEAIFAALGARETLTSPVRIGLHLMGGCVIGTQGRTSVVNPDFEVHDHPNLLVADSSLFPSAPGINPSLTIMALAHRASEIFLGERTPNAPAICTPEEVCA